MQNSDMVLVSTGTQQKTQEHSDIPEFPTRKRKCRDVYCWILFILFYGGLIFAFIYLKVYNNKNNILAIMQPGDDFRRLCGSKTQIDQRSADLSQYMTTVADIKDFCKYLKAKKGQQLLTNCDVMKGSQSRAMFREAKVLFQDVQDLKASYQIGNHSICLNLNELLEKSGENHACNSPKSASYGCAPEFYRTIIDVKDQALLAAALAAFTIPSIDTIAKISRAFFTTEEMKALSNLLNSDADLKQFPFINNFCWPIAPFQGEGDRADHMFHPVTQVFGFTTCINDPSAGISFISEAIKYVTTYFENFMASFIAEIKLQWKWIVAGICSSVLVAAVYFLFLRYFLKLLIWLVIVCLILGLGVVGAYLLYQGYELKKINDVWLEFFGYINESYIKQIDLYLGFGYSIVIIDAVLLLLLFIFCRAINIACEVIKLSVVCLKKIWFVFFLPIIFVIIMVIHVAWTGALAYLFYLSGSYDEQLNQFDFVKLSYDKDNFLVKENDHLNLSMLVLLVFGVIWGVFFVYAWLEFTISHIVVQWYFNPNRDKHHFCDAACNAFKAFIKSSGTILFASFITSLVVLARWLLEYFMKRVMQTPGAKQNKLLTTLHKCGAYCLRCLQKCVEFINRNAQIYACISGEGYCKSAFAAIKLLLGEIRATIAVKGLSVFILFLGKVLVTACSTIICYVLVITVSEAKQAFISACVVTALCSYLVSYYLLEIVELVVDTIYFCFLYEEQHLSRDREKGAKAYAPPELAALLD